MKEFLPSRRKNWTGPSVSSCCRADRRYTTDPGVASGPTAARNGWGNMVHCRPAWLEGVRVNLHKYPSSPRRREKSDYSLQHKHSTVTCQINDHLWVSVPEFFFPAVLIKILTLVIELMPLVHTGSMAEQHFPSFIRGSKKMKILRRWEISEGKDGSSTKIKQQNF